MALIKDQYRREKDYLRVYCLLLDAAHNRTTIEYGEIANVLGRKLGGNYSGWIGNVLGGICEDEHNCGRPLLSCLAVSKASSIPNEGFFSFAKDLGLDPGDSEEDKRVFWTKELMRTYKAWRG